MRLDLVEFLDNCREQAWLLKNSLFLKTGQNSGIENVQVVEGNRL
jgi:hypothetical protein